MTFVGTYEIQLQISTNGLEFWLLLLPLSRGTEWFWIFRFRREVAVTAAATQVITYILQIKLTLISNIILLKIHITTTGMSEETSTLNSRKIIISWFLAWEMGISFWPDTQFLPQNRKQKNAYATMHDIVVRIPAEVQINAKENECHFSIHEIIPYMMPICIFFSLFPTFWIFGDIFQANWMDCEQRSMLFECVSWVWIQSWHLWRDGCLLEPTHIFVWLCNKYSSNKISNVEW